MSSAAALRAPLVGADLTRTLVRPGGRWHEIRVLAETDSTNAEAAAAARAGAPEGLVLAAEYQRAGRGRAGRSWTSPPGAGLLVSVLLRPPVPSAHWGTLPMLAGVALVEAVTAEAGLIAVLKWPNDLLVDGHKCAGILLEVVGDAVVIGIGLNVTHHADELPPELPATSLLLAGARHTDRAALLQTLLDRLAGWYDRWCVAGGVADAIGLRSAYQRWCVTLDQQVRVRLPDGSELAGLAREIDSAGRLVLSTDEGIRVLAAGDITHLRPLTGGPPGA